MKNYFKYLSANKKYNAITILLAFFLGMVFFSANSQNQNLQKGMQDAKVAVTNCQPTVKEVVKEVPATTCDYTTWRELKNTDDDIFRLAGDFANETVTMMGLCKDGVNAAAAQDTAKILSVAEQIRVNNEKIKVTANSVQNMTVIRNDVIKRLGY